MEMDQSNFHSKFDVNLMLLYYFYVGTFPIRAQKGAIICCSDDIHKLLDITSVLPRLYAKGLLSDEEFEILSSPYLTRQHKINTLIKGLPLKGSDFLDRFIQCLHDTVDGTGHKELIDLILPVTSRANWFVQHPGEYKLMVKSNLGAK